METSRAVEVLSEITGDVKVDELTNETGAQTASTFSPEEQAAARFLYLLPYIKKFGNALNQKAVVRVLHALAEFPLSDGKPKLLSAQEAQLFDIFQELLATKSVIVKNVLEKQKADADASAEKEVTDGNTEA